MNKFVKRKTIGSVIQGMCYVFVTLLFTVSCAKDDVVQENKQKKDNIPAGAIVFTGVSQMEVTTRTVILNHTKGSDASVNWSSTDKIWVKDDAGIWQQSGAVTFPFATDKTKGVFALSGTYTGTTHDILYTNKAIGTQPQVEIKATQVQPIPNNFDHADESGDFGIATGNKTGDIYKFTLNHKAAYLCFIPRSSNPYVNRSKLIKVEIMSDDNIAGTYDIAANGALTLASSGSKTITITTGSGFDIDNSTDDMSKNATYAVIAPGTHKVRIRYWLRNTTDNPGGTIEGTVSKYVTLNCTAGSIQDITANLDPHEYNGDHYYLWDALNQYWKGYEWNLGGNQPTLSRGLSGATESSNYPREGDSRYFNTIFPGSHVNNPAIYSCERLPNANGMVWYAKDGDPHWDGDELWVTMGHLYKGGIWFKKRAYISGFNTNNAPGYGDWRLYDHTNYYWSVSNILPLVEDANKYFYLPASGYYSTGRLYSVGNGGFYWSSSASPSSAGRIFAYCLYFHRDKIFVDTFDRGNGLRVHAFE